MNKDRRERLAEIHTLLEEARHALEEVQEEEGRAFDNMPEGLQTSERGQKLQENHDTMEEAVSTLDDLLSTILELTQ